MGSVISGSWKVDQESQATVVDRQALLESRAVPIYEFLCSDCNTLFNFFSASINTDKRPACPKCGRPELERRPARFAMLKHSGSEEDSDDPFDQIDDDALEKAMMGMAGELEGLEDSEDPRVYANVLRKMGEATGLELGPKMEEMLSKLDAGADLDELDDDMGEGDEDDFEDFFRLKKKVAQLRKRRPRVDEELYFL